VGEFLGALRDDRKNGAFRWSPPLSQDNERVGATSVDPLAGGGWKGKTRLEENRKNKLWGRGNDKRRWCVFVRTFCSGRQEDLWEIQQTNGVRGWVQGWESSKGLRVRMPSWDGRGSNRKSSLSCPKGGERGKSKTIGGDSDKKVV